MGFTNLLFVLSKHEDTLSPEGGKSHSCLGGLAVMTHTQNVRDQGSLPRLDTEPTVITLILALGYL